MASLVKAHSDDNLDDRRAFYAKPKLALGGSAWAG